MLVRKPDVQRTALYEAAKTGRSGAREMGKNEAQEWTEEL